MLEFVDWATFPIRVSSIRARTLSIFNIFVRIRINIYFIACNGFSVLAKNESSNGGEKLNAEP